MAVEKRSFFKISVFQMSFYDLKYVFFHEHIVAPPTPQKKQNIFFEKQNHVFTVNKTEFDTLWCFFHSII